jgi:hypothetical protein
MVHGADEKEAAVSADTHSAAPRHAVTPAERLGRVATAAGEDWGAPERPSGEQAVLSRESMLAWAADSSIMPAVDTRPRLRQMLSVCGWAAVLGVAGLVVGFRGFVAALLHQTPSWYEPMMGGIGALGIALTVAAFVSVHRRHTPYILLGAATMVLGYAIFLTAQAI